MRLGIGIAGYRKAAAAALALALLAGCGGSSRTTLSDVEKALRVSGIETSDVRCEHHGTYRGEDVYRCHLMVQVSVREMRPESRCYTFEHGRLEDVTRHVSC